VLAAPAARVALAVAASASLGCASAVPPGRSVAIVERARAGLEPPPPPRARAVVDLAATQVGKRYCWGGTGPSCFDCSGLVQWAWRAAGVRLPRTADAIADEVPAVSFENLRAGDILWWPGHVGLYAGMGWVIEALDSHHGVVRRPVKSPYRALRPVL
jgi:cell wall-associated NlpC family hydrolase